MLEDDGTRSSGDGPCPREDGPRPRGDGTFSRDRKALSSDEGSRAAIANGHAATPSRTPHARSVLELVEQLERLADELTSHDPADLDGHAAAEASVRAHRAMDRVHAARLGWLARVEADAAWIGNGARSVVAWAARVHDVAFPEARAWISTARAWRDVLPQTARAARSGIISTVKGALVARTATTPARIDALTAASSADPSGAAGLSAGGEPTDATTATTGEATLIALASGYDVAAFTKIARRFAHVTDPEADERGYREALAREHFDLAATRGGYHLSGFLTFDHGQAVKTALRAVTGVPAADDTRTAGQRRAAALTSLSQVVLDKGLTGKVGTVRPHVSVHVSQTELDRLLHDGAPCGPGVSAPGYPAPAPAPAPPPSTLAPDLTALLLSPPAEWDDGTSPVPDAVLRRLVTDCEVARVVFGPSSEVRDVGRSQRTFSGHLRRAIVARDRHCVIAGCTAPPSIGQIHHASTRWADGGATSLDNAALVCAFHNQWLEDHRVPMRRVVDPNGLAVWQTGVPGSYRPGGGGRFPQDDPSHPDHVPRSNAPPPTDSG